MAPKHGLLRGREFEMKGRFTPKFQGVDFFSSNEIKA